ncbi:MAG TPA: hypothetical protein VF572_01125 [Candidatus Saccharimonadales bacterium]|jgi:hypothetical protein
MIGNSSPEQIKAITAHLMASDELLLTDQHLDNGLAALGLDPVDPPLQHFEIKPRKGVNIALLVASYAVIDEEGFLDETVRPVYGVTAKPSTTTGSPAARTRARQAHVFAENRTQRNGLFTERGREAAEILAVELIPEVNQPEFIRDRLAHLHSLEREVSRDYRLTKKQKRSLTAPLELGAAALETRIVIED